MMKYGWFVVSLLTLPVHAIVNIENLNAQPTRLGWSGLGEAALDLRYGNSERQAIKLSGRADWFEGEDTAFVVSAYEYGQSQGLKDADSFFVHGRFIDALTRSISWEYFTQHEQNDFRRLKRRDLAGAGIRHAQFNFGGNIQHTYAYGLFYGDETVESLAAEEEDYRSGLYGNLYWVFKWQINPNANLANTLYYQPSLEGENDFRMVNLFALNVRIDGRLYVKLSVDLEHDSMPPFGVKKTDSRVLSGISYEF